MRFSGRGLRVASFDSRSSLRLSASPTEGATWHAGHPSPSWPVSGDTAHRPGRRRRHPRCECGLGEDPRRLAWPHLVPVQEGRGREEQVLGQLRRQLARLLATGRPAAGTGVKAFKLATTRRSDRKTQVVYNSHPLYRFIGDKKPGNSNGQGLTAFGAGSWSHRPDTRSGGTTENTPPEG